MSVSFMRRAAMGIGHLTAHIFPRHQSTWSRAMLHEIAAVEDDWEALGFAAGCLRVAIGQAVVCLFSGTRAATMKKLKDMMQDPRSVGLACAVLAGGLGLAYLGAAGAPARYMLVNAASLMLGLLAFPALAKTSGHAARWPGGLMLVLGMLLLATALFGASVEGAARWVRLGPVNLQVSMVFLPAMIIAFAQHRGVASAAGVALTAIALALQPDRAMAGVLAAGLAALAIRSPDRATLGALAVAVVAFALTVLRPDTLPAAPYVDQILYTAFQVHPLAGAAVLVGAFLLIVPALVGRGRDASHGGAYAAFGIVWLGIVVAAALGNYPTPLVGFGGSAVVGYFLSLAFLPDPSSRTARAPHEVSSEERPSREGGTQLSAAVA